MDTSALRTERALIPPRAPGVYSREQVPMAEYLAWDAVSAGLLKDVLDRGCGFADRKRRIVRDDSDATERGTAVHTAILEPHDFDKRYAPLSVECDLRTSAGKAEKAAIVASGRRAVKAAVWETCLRLRDRAWEHPILSRLLAECETEVSVLSEVGVGDLIGKARADVLARGAETILDLKTTLDASPFAFGRSAADYGYHLSSPWYLDTFERAGVGVRYWTLAALEADPDVGHYDVALYTLDPLVVARARAKIDTAARTWAAARASGNLRARPDTYLPLPMPAWAFQE